MLKIADKGGGGAVQIPTNLADERDWRYNV